MKILFLSNNDVSRDLFKWLSETESDVIEFDKPLSLEYLKNLSPDFIVSYNYKHIIKPEIIAFMNGKIVNLHISLLPWNRGASPNFWSFIENTPKGVTIHYIDDGLDAGDIITQKELFFNEDEETFRTVYYKLHKEMTALFIQTWDHIKSDSCVRIKQDLTKGSYHTISEFEVIVSNTDFSWDEIISEAKKKYPQFTPPPKKCSAKDAESKK